VKTAPPVDYLDGLEMRLAAGARRLPAAFRKSEARWVLAAQQPDGGLAGRRGGSDLYYTSFGLRSAALLGMTDGAFRARAARWVAAAPAPREVVDAYCLLQSRRLLGLPLGADLGGALERCRGVYDAFLAALCGRMLGREVDGARAFVAAARQAADGAGTNQAAAALGLLAMEDELDEPTAERASRYLASMQRPEGGFAAHAGAPADLLSTFTALAALGDLAALGRVKLAPAARFARSLRAPGGGFRGAPRDGEVDVEYSYYGVATIALLSYAAGRHERNA
jgi:geranylgeranyl transferase type-2 subunit beta